MATARKTAAQKKKAEPDVVSRLAEKGEEALARLRKELGKNPKVAEALHRAVAAKGKLDSASHAALSQLGLATTDDVKALRKEIAALEKRLAKLEGKPAPRRAAARKTAEAGAKSEAA